MHIINVKIIAGTIHILASLFFCSPIGYVVVEFVGRPKPDSQFTHSVALSRARATTFAVEKQ